MANIKGWLFTCSCRAWLVRGGDVCAYVKHRGNIGVTGLTTRLCDRAGRYYQAGDVVLIRSGYDWFYAYVWQDAKHLPGIHDMDAAIIYLAMKGIIR